MALWEEAMPFLVAAVRADGAAVLAGVPDTEVDTAAGVGRRLLWGILGGQVAGARLPELLAPLAASPDDAGVLDALGGEVAAALHDDAHLQVSAAQTLTGFYRREIEAGSTEAMVQLGDFLRTQDDLDGARAAYQQAIDCGDVRAMLRLARLLRGDVGDAEGARGWFQRVIDGGDAKAAAEASVDLGHLLVMFQHDGDGARAAFQQAIDSGHAECAPDGHLAPADSGAAGDGLMGLLGDYDGIVASGERSWSARISVQVGDPGSAVMKGAGIITSLAAQAGMPHWPAVRVEAVRDDVLDEDLARSQLPELVSVPEAAAILGVSPQRVHQLATQHAEFPQPAYELKVGRLWFRAGIEAFAERERKPGRPALARAAG